MTELYTAVKEFNDALSHFFLALDDVGAYWSTNSYELPAHQQRAFVARNRVTKLAPSIVSAIIPPSGQSALQFVAGILDDVETAWNLCRYVHCIDPIEDEPRPEDKRLQGEIHERLPVLRNNLWEAWRHIRHTIELSGTESETPTNESIIAVSASGTTKPTWNRDRGQLCFDGRPIRSIRSVSVAKNVVTILDAFQEEDWPDRIDDPLGPSKNQQRLHETIRRLNNDLSMIRFRADGTGTGIVWQELPAGTRTETAQEPHKH